MHITHIYEKYKFSPLFYILFFHNCLFSKNLYGVNLEGQLTQNFQDIYIEGVVGKANRMIGLIKISFECMDKNMFLNLYKTHQPGITQQGEKNLVVENSKWYYCW